MLKALAFLICFMSFVLHANENTFQDTFHQTLQEGKILNQKAQETARHFDPESVFTGYTANPPETAYFQGVNQADTEKMETDAQQKVGSVSGNAITESIYQRPQFSLNPQESSFLHAKLIESEADNILRGVTSQYTDCQPKKACENHYETKTCIEARLDAHSRCRQNLIVNARMPDNALQTVKINLQARTVVRKRNRPAWLKIDLTTGKILETDNAANATFSITPRVPQNTCQTNNIEFLGWVNNKPGQALGVEIPEAPHCENQNHLVMAVKLFDPSGSHVLQEATLSYRIQLALPPVVEERWQSTCSYYDTLVEKGVCQRLEELCVEPQATKSINGLSVTRPCWAKETTFQCQTQKTENPCAPLKAEGCEQMDSVCQSKVGDICLAYESRYRCPQTQCVNTADIVCGDGKIYCLNGDCTETTYPKSEDFNEGITALSALYASTKDFEAKTGRIFSGHVEQCRDDAANFNNCCKDKGWGQDIHLAHCSQEEKTLGHHKEQGVTVYVGRYCAKKMKFPIKKCLQYKKSYCVFGSKLGKLIQEQGRHHQLRIDFGDAEEPNCRGMTVEEFQKLDLSKVDFREALPDLKGRIKSVDSHEVSTVIQDHIAQHQARVSS